MPKSIDLNKFAGGQLAEKLSQEFQKVVNNINDANTSEKFKRKLILEITFNPSADREVAEVNINVNSKLAPIKPASTRIMMERDYDTGLVVAAELRSAIAGQVEMEIPEPKPEGDNVIDLQRVNENKKQ